MTTKRYAKTLIENKAVNTFLFLLSNTPIIEIKELNIKLITFLIN